MGDDDDGAEAWDLVMPCSKGGLLFIERGRGVVMEVIEGTD
jgi:hypothetical protein